jgi:hypothetical protein
MLELGTHVLGGCFLYTSLLFVLFAVHDIYTDSSRLFYSTRAPSILSVDSGAISHRGATIDG